MMASSAVAVALPFALVPVAMRIAQESAPGYVRRRAALRMCRVAFLLQLTLVGFVMPWAVHAWHLSTLQTAGRPMPATRGPRELALIELMQPGQPGAGGGLLNMPLDEERHRRASLILTPLVLALTGWSLGRVVGPAWCLRATAWWSIVGLLFVVLRAQWAAEFGPTAAEWLPLTILLGLSASLQAIVANGWHLAFRPDTKRAAG